MSDYQCLSCGGFCKKSGCERENVPPQSNGWAEYNTLVDRILKGTSYSHIDDWLASRAALIGEVEPVAYERYGEGPRIALFTAGQLATAAANERKRCLTICEELEQHYSAIKDTALLNGDIDLSNAASGEPRACEAIAAAIREG